MRHAFTEIEALSAQCTGKESEFDREFGLAEENPRKMEGWMAERLTRHGDLHFIAFCQ
jgi:hypothetical protein